MTDFGTDHSFGRVPEKLKEHYGISLPVSAVRKITETHAYHIHERRLQERIEEYPAVTGRDCVVAETDGSMAPIVVTDKNGEDRRKGKKRTRKEARLCLAHVPGDTTLKFGVEFQENVDEAGKVLFDCACRAGFGRGTYLHSVGDGVSWIFGQAEKRFGPHGHYLFDFYHLREYLEGAAPACSGNQPSGTVRLSRCSGTGPACRFRRNRECASVCYSGASENSRCMVDTGKCPNHAFPKG